MMKWIAEHVVTSILIAAFVCIGTGYAIVERTTRAETKEQGSSWSGLAGFFKPREISGTQGKSPTPQELIQSIQTKNPLVLGEIIFGNAQPTSSDLLYEVDDIAALLASIKPSASPQQNPENIDSLSDIYSFLPKGLISTTPATPSRTPRQQALYTYGNEAGSFIETYALANTNQGAILMEYLEDTGNTEKRAKVQKIAGDLEAVGKGIASIESMPEDVAAMNTSLSRGYVDLSVLLSAIFKANSDQERLNAINGYNARADQHAKEYLNLVTLFSVSDVRFSSTDPGRVFMFTSQ